MVSVRSTDDTQRYGPNRATDRRRRAGPSRHGKWPGVRWPGDLKSACLTLKRSLVRNGMHRCLFPAH